MKSPIRVVLQQPALPKYRVPIFRELAARPGIDLKVVYGEVAGLPNVAPEGFAGELRPIRSLKLGGRTLLWHWPQVSHASRRRADVLILSWNLHFATLVPALVIAKLAGVRTVLFGHGYSRSEGGVRKSLRGAVGRLADALLFYGRRTAGQFIEDGWDPTRIYVAPNALDQSAIGAAREDWLARPDDLAAFKRSIGVEGRRVLLFVSRLLPENRIDLLVEAAAILKRGDHPNVAVVLVGAGDPSALRARAERLGIADAVHVAGAVYEEAKVAPYFLSADLFVYPAKLGLSIMHCFGYGLPIVTAASQDTQYPEREALVENVNGATYRDDDAADLAATIGRLLSDDDERGRMARAALRTVQTAYSVEAMVDGFEAAIRGRPVGAAPVMQPS